MQAHLMTRVTDLRQDAEPLTFTTVADPEPSAGQVLVRVAACGVCHTELDEIEGRTPPPTLPMIPGHQVVGRVVARGDGAKRFEVGDRVGVAWIFDACGACEFCRRGDENLCSGFRATGRDAHGGYAELMVVPEAFAHPIPAALDDAAAAPLLCAGAIGYRSLRLCNLTDGQTLGLTGFGASAHLVLKLMAHHHPSSEVYVFARNERERRFARELGAVWAGDTSETAPVRLDAIIDTTPAWLPVREALRNLERGGRLVINAIRKEAGDQESLLGLDWATHLWEEKEIKSVANVARRDVSEFLELAAAAAIRPEVVEYGPEEANRALVELRRGGQRGAKVLRMS